MARCQFTKTFYIIYPSNSVSQSPAWTAAFDIWLSVLKPAHSTVVAESGKRALFPRRGAMLLEKPEDVRHENGSGTGALPYLGAVRRCAFSMEAQLNLWAVANLDMSTQPVRYMALTLTRRSRSLLRLEEVCSALHDLLKDATNSLDGDGTDNTVKIWSLEPAGDENVATFELLATLAFHQQAVNCVRWAGHGRYLASGSDDQLVQLYELQSGAPPPVPFGSNAKPNKQNWGRCATLKRHTMGTRRLVVVGVSTWLAYLTSRSCNEKMFRMWPGRRMIACWQRAASTTPS